MKGSRPQQAALSRDTDMSKTGETRRVIEGMEVIDAIADVQTSRRGQKVDVPILPVFVDRAYQVKN